MQATVVSEPGSQSVLRVTLIVWSGNVGGAETQSVSLARELHAQGVETSVIFICRAAPLGHRLEDAGLPFIELGFSRGTRVFLAPDSLRRALRRYRPHVTILAQGSALAPLVRSALRHCAIVHVQHTGYFWYSYGRRLVELAGGLCQRHFVDVDVAVSDFVLRSMQHTLHARRTTRIYNGVELDRFHPKELPRECSPVVVGFAGRLGAGKGVEDLIEASSRLRGTHAFELRIAGTGPLRESLESLARERLDAGSYRFVGHQSDMPGYWNLCDLAVVPTNGLIESFGMVAAEAMGCARPVVASRAGGLAEVVSDGETGLLFDPGNTQELADRLAQYLADPSLRHRHGQAARRRAEKCFDMRVTASAYERLCRELARAE